MNRSSDTATDPDKGAVGGEIIVGNSGLPRDV